MWRERERERERGRGRGMSPPPGAHTHREGGKSPPDSVVQRRPQELFCAASSLGEVRCRIMCACVLVCALLIRIGLTENLNSKTSFRKPYIEYNEQRREKEDGSRRTVRRRNSE